MKQSLNEKAAKRDRARAGAGRIFAHAPSPARCPIIEQEDFPRWQPPVKDKKAERSVPRAAGAFADGVREIASQSRPSGARSPRYFSAPPL